MATAADHDRIVARWLPRLGDRATGVQEEAAEKLSEVAAAHPEVRTNLLPKLFDLARKTDSWPVASNSIMYPMQEIPKEDPEWLEQFVGLYIDLAKRDEHVTSENAYGYLANLITEGHLTAHDAQFQQVIAMAKSDVATRDGDERKHIFAILDWVEDNV